MDGKKNRRLIELFKSLLIVALTLSAALLMGRAQLARIPAVSSWVGSVLGVFADREAPQDGQSGGSDLNTGLRPVCLAVRNESGRYGIQYDSDAVNASFEKELGTLLGEALAQAGEAYTVSEEAWRLALCAPEASVYYDFLGSVPLSALSGWLGGETNVRLTADARRLLLVSGGGGAVLYYCGAHGEYYACSVAGELSARLREVAGDYTPNNAVFAFEWEERYPKLAPYVMILPDPPAPPVYTSSNPIGTGEEADLSVLLRGLSFQPQTSEVYTGAEGLVVREGMDTLRIGTDGTVFFHASDRQNPRYPVRSAGETATKGELVETARVLLDRGFYPGDAGFYLMGTEPGQDGTLCVYFGYLLSGCAVEVAGDGYAARVVLTEGYISEFTLHCRTYQKTGEISAVLPEVQAVAAMNALTTDKSELLLRYLDGGGSVPACWVAG